LLHAQRSRQRHQSTQPPRPPRQRPTQPPRLPWHQSAQPPRPHRQQAQSPPQPRSSTARTAMVRDRARNTASRNLDLATRPLDPEPRGGAAAAAAPRTAPAPEFGSAPTPVCVSARQCGHPSPFSQKLNSSRHSTGGGSDSTTPLAPLAGEAAGDAARPTANSLKPYYQMQ